MSKSESDIEAFREQWSKRGRDICVLDFSPDVVLVQLGGPFSANELRNIADFLDEVEDDRE